MYKKICALLVCLSLLATNSLWSSGIHEKAGVPAMAELPAVSEEPAALETPAAMEVPAATEVPVATETPAATEMPAVTETPVPVEGTPSPAPQGMITALLDQGSLENIGAVSVYAGDPDPLYYEMFEWQYVQAAAIAPDGAQETLQLKVDWDLTRLSTDFNVPGQYSESAPILAPEGYVFADGVATEVTIPVIVLEPVPNLYKIVSFDDISGCYAYAIDQGSDWNEFFSWEFSDDRWYETWPCNTDAGETLWADITWENPLPDTDKTGQILVSGSAVLPENAVLAEGASLPSVQVPVSIQSVENPGLNSWYMSFGNINIPWSGSGMGEDESPTLLISIDGGEWEPTADVEYDGSALVVYLPWLEKGHSYQVKAVWDGGETGVFHFNWDGELTDVGGYEGDRDGGDSEGNEAGTVVQPAPTRDSEAESESSGEKKEAAVFYEESGDTYSLISGTRLMLMREGGPVRFSKQGITLTLSDAALDALDVGEDSRFYICLMRTGDGFIFTAELDGKPIESLPDTKVILPVSSPHTGPMPALRNEQREFICWGDYNSAENTVMFTVHAAGAYSMTDTSRIEAGIHGFFEALDQNEEAPLLRFVAWLMQLLASWLP